MRSLTLKIFVSYWITAALVIVVLNLVGHPVHRPEFGRALNTLLQTNGRTLANTFEAQHCSDPSAFAAPPGTSFYLTHADGSVICGALNVPGIPSLAARALASNGQMARKFYLDYELLAMAVRSRTGAQYVYIMEEPYAQPGQIFGVLTPSYTTIAISVIFTLFLAYLLTRPLRRLRYATQQIASGKLETRVVWARRSKSGELAADIRPNRLDEISGLIYDFNHMADRLQTSLSAQHLLLRDVSHELRSPLTRLQVALELARQHSHDGMGGHLDRIARESANINSMVGELLSLSFMESMNTISQPAVVSLTELMVRLVQDARYEAENSQRTLSNSILENCYVLGDPTLLRRAIENVVRNAIRFSPAGGHVHVDLGRSAKSDSAIVRVDDTGPGIPESELNAILQPFYRVDRSRNGDTGGSGVGLSIAARAVHLHHGTIAFANRSEGGLSASICLPLTSTPDMAEPVLL